MNEAPNYFSTHTAGEQPPAPKSGPGVGQFLAAGLIGGLVVGAIFAILIVTGVIGAEKTVVQSAGFGSTGDGDVPTVNAVYKKSGSGVVYVKSNVTQASDNPFGGSQQGTATGSGFVVDDDGYIATNAHVVEGSSQVTVQFGDDTAVSAKVVGTDASNDIAILKVDVDDDKLSPLDLGDSSKSEVGDPVIAIGNPFGLDRTVTTGIVSALQRRIDAPNGFQIDHVIQTDAAINPGNSGGPLLDAQGRVIGINSQIATSGTSEGNVGIGFAVPVNTLKKVLPQIKKGGTVKYAYLGVSTTELTKAIADRLNLGEIHQGALIDAVVKGGPAAKAGLKGGDIPAEIDGNQVNLGGDVIVEIDGKKVTTSEDVAAQVTTRKPGDIVTIVVLRNGQRKSVKVKLGTRPDEAQNKSSQGDQSP